MYSILPLQALNAIRHTTVIGAFADLSQYTDCGFADLIVDKIRLSLELGLGFGLGFRMHQYLHLSHCTIQTANP